MDVAAVYTICHIHMDIDILTVNVCMYVLL